MVAWQGDVVLLQNLGGQVLAQAHRVPRVLARLQATLPQNLCPEESARPRMKRPAVCLVSSQHLSYNPRLLKEADALHGAGYQVRVAAMNLELAKAEWDRRLMAERAWRLETVDACRGNLRGRLTWARASLRQRFYVS